MTDAAVSPPPPRWLRTWRGRALAAVFGATVSGLVATIGFWAAIEYVSIVCLFGVPAAALIGFLFGPRAAATSRPALDAVGLGLLAVPAGLSVIALASLLAVGGSGDVLPFILFAVLAIPFAAPVSVPVSLLTVYIGRRLIRRGMSNVTVIVMLAALATAGVGAATWAEAVRRAELTASGQPQEPHWVDRLVSPVDLRWSAVNESDRELVLYVAEPTTNGETGSMRFLAPCSATSGVEAIGPDWQIHLAENSGDPWPPDYDDPLVTSRDRPGPDPAVSIVVDANGRAALASSTDPAIRCR